jgi:EAL domain-containing protein (putative c-di-GMP-specific phosphodiesterase class I)
LLRDAGCLLAQGYLYANPLTQSQLVALYPELLGDGSYAEEA